MNVKSVAELLEVLKQQIVRWGIWSNIYGGILCIVVLCIGYYLQRLALKKMSNDDDPRWIFLRMVSIMVMVFVGIFLINCVYNLIKVLCAPYVYILEGLRK